MEYPHYDEADQGSPNMDELEGLKVDFSFLIDQLENKPSPNINRSPIKTYQPKNSYIRNNLLNDLSIDGNTPNLKNDSHDFGYSNENGLFQVTRAISPPRKRFRSNPTSDSEISMETQSMGSVLDSYFEDNGKYVNNDDDFFTNKRLDNSKIDKLLREMTSKQGPNFDYELDDQLRTRLFQGRFKPFVGDEDLENKLSSYFNNDKENIDDPLNMKIKLTNNDKGQIKKSSKVYFKSPRRRKDMKSLIPVLKPISINSGIPNYGSINNSNTNPLTQFDLNPNTTTNNSINNSNNNNNNNNKQILLRSPKRICSPRKTIVNRLKPALKYPLHSNKIYIVDSLTGSVNDATQFGTELNASNCEGFPLPEDTNEIVQIPTNDETIKSKQKMAIIKLFNSKNTKSKLTNNISLEQNNKKSSTKDLGNENQIYDKIGFYNNQEQKVFMEVVASKSMNNQSINNNNNKNDFIVNNNDNNIKDTGVEFIQNANTDFKADISSVQTKKKNCVRWADDIEW